MTIIFQIKWSLNMSRIQNTSLILLTIQLSGMWPFWHNCYAISVLDNNPLVTSRAGPIRGFWASDRDYYLFLGIPFGKVDKRNPFGRSIPYPKFKETFNAFDDSVVCPQREEFNKTLVGTIDCLTLNIYVPFKATSINRLPVLVYIFGGSFSFGFAGRYVYGPKFLVNQDIIVVTPNYRLGPYGFMCLDDPEVSGNQGIKDQLLAMRWIKNNIEAFGGDVNKITLAGLSAGSMSVDLHIHSPTEDLFQQAILQSGTAVTPFLFDNPGIEGPLKLARYLGHETDNVNKALSFLATVDTNNVITASENLNLNFKMCVEKRFDDVEAIVTDYPINLQAIKVKNISILIGFSENEELRRYGRVNADYLKNEDVLRRYIEAYFDFDNKTYEKMKAVLKYFYFGNDEVNIETRRQITKLASDLQGCYPVLRSLRKYFDSGAGTIFSYMFSYDGRRNYVKYKRNITVEGASHGDELGYLFDMWFFNSNMSEDLRIIDVMTTMWANFVKYGNPTPETSELLPVVWDPVTRERWNYLHIDTTLSMKARPFRERMAFLDFFFKINEKFQIGYRNKHLSHNVSIKFIMILIIIVIISLIIILRWLYYYT